MKPWLSVLALAVAGSLAAQAPPPNSKSPWEQRFSGYFKNLASGSRSYFTKDAWGDNLSRLRLSYDGKYKSWFQLHVDYDNEFHAGNLIGQPDFALVRDRQAGTWLGLQHTILDDPHAYWDTSLYRGYFSVRKGSVALTVGRQRIAWGTAHFWSPADAFNPISPLQIEPNERQGVDAALLEWTSPGALRWNVVYAPQNGFQRSTSAVRLGRTIQNYDVDVFAGRFQRDWMGGFDFAGQVGGAGLHGELTYRWRHPIAGTVPVATMDALRFVIGSDYAFPNGLYVIGEYFYNQGQPQLSPQGMFDPGVLLRYSSEIFTLRRHFLSAGARYDVTPLWRVESYVIADIQGPGAVILPTLKHNLTANTDLSLGAQLFTSAKGGEFRGFSNLVYVEFLFHFQ